MGRCAMARCYGSCTRKSKANRIYKCAHSYRPMGDTMFKLLHQAVMVMVPRPSERMQIALDTHLGMGDFAVQGEGWILGV